FEEGFKFAGRNRFTFFGDDVGEGAFDPFFVGDGDHGGFPYGRMAHQGVLERDRADPFAAGFDDIFAAVFDLDAAFGADGDDVAGFEPAVWGEFGVGRLRVRRLGSAIVGCGYPGAADFQFAHGGAIPGDEAVFVAGADLYKWYRLALFCRVFVLRFFGCLPD